MPQAAERKALEKGLQKLNENMVTLAELAELSIRKAVDGLTRLDPEVAQEVFTLDQEVYGLQLEIERTCIDLLALHAPVARDLRTITTSLKITTDLDRIGRYGKDLSELTLQFRDRHIVERADVARIQEMADRTITMVDTAIEAFVHRNAESVRNIIEVDDDLLVNRYFERIADHAVNIGLRVVYMVTGDWLPRVRAADRAKRRDEGSSKSTP
ncbi:MAG: hypothetical protein E6K12_00560 [Methanobacteriota archaeon]|nr:MAG: hypothetical protein E6K12_00560 [Euryarchaeota archaeon]